MSPKLGDLSRVLSKFISSLLILVGAFFIIMLVIGGFNYLSAGGDKQATARAQSTLTYAFLGLMLSASAWLILSVLGNFFGVNFNTLNICIQAPC